MDFSSRPLGAKKTENEKTEVEEEKKSSLFFTFFFSNLDPSLFSLSLSLSLFPHFFLDSSFCVALSGITSKKRKKQRCLNEKQTEKRGQGEKVRFVFLPF